MYLKKNVIDLHDSHNLPYSIVSIELEPTHYKTDLWNAVAASQKVEAFVLYTQLKNWAPDGGHNYLNFPKSKYNNRILTGHGFIEKLRSIYIVIKNIIVNKTDMVIICGYSDITRIFALLTCFVMNRRFSLLFDELNNMDPYGKYSSLKLFVRNKVRKFCFKFASAILVCGQNGIKSAIEAGCNTHKIFDYPYVIDVDRILTDAPEVIPEPCLVDIDCEASIIFFSGRMIERKGLSSLLKALSTLDAGKDWILWIEGDGPQLEKYINMADKYGIAKHCRFLGFCQYDVHSWLLRSANIVVVPSLQDNWGIVVDEGLQLGKLVISSDATGSCCDRIEHGVNGYSFHAGNFQELANLIRISLDSEYLRNKLGHVAKNSHRNIKPLNNLNTLLAIVKGV